MLEQDLTFILQYMKKVCIHLQRYIWECDIKEKVAEDIRSLRDLVSALQNELADKLQHASK